MHMWKHALFWSLYFFIVLHYELGSPSVPRPPSYTSSFHVPKWNRIKGVPAFVSLVLKITSVHPTVSTAMVLETYQSPSNNAPDVTGCAEARLLWTLVPLVPYQNVKMYIARCTPTRERNVTMM